MKTNMSSDPLTSVLVIAVLLCASLPTNLAIEPGKSNQDFESIEEVQSHEESTTEMEIEPEDVTWVPEAVLDVAYYLRKFKYNGYDPRYMTEGGVPRKDLYSKFPIPQLRTLHWEVKKNCEPSFIDCIKYIQDTVTQTELPRHLDSITIVYRNAWTMDKDQDLIRASDDACVQLRERDERTFNVFQGPLQRFQWLTTASYYMCWYTLREIPHLISFSEPCDNFANCIEWSTGPRNGDIRADNGVPFACAFFSFCPDPCCPQRLARDMRYCNAVNPCRRHRPADQTCRMERSENVDFESLMLNYWNVSCNCDEPGMRWESRSGMCVDIDECIESSPCVTPYQSCMNLRNGYRCVCNPMGYKDDGMGNCVPDPIIQSVIHPPRAEEESRHENKTAADSFFDFVYRLKSILSGPGDRERGERDDDAENVTRDMFNDTNHKHQHQSLKAMM